MVDSLMIQNRCKTRLLYVYYLYILCTHDIKLKYTKMDICTDTNTIKIAFEIIYYTKNNFN